MKIGRLLDVIDTPVELKAECKSCEPLLYYNLRPVPAFFLCRCMKVGMGSIRHPSKQTTTREHIISMQTIKSDGLLHLSVILLEVGFCISDGALQGVTE